jgi:iron-sulfur cluster repair protein YtfE (RIC family)
MPEILKLLHEDHVKVKNLFKDFEKAEDAETKKGIVDAASIELMAHTQLEEELFYPAIRKEGEEAAMLIDEAEEEHHVVKFLISELAGMKPNMPRYDAKFMVMRENVEHHIQEEESAVFDQAEEMGRERLERMGEQFMERKEKVQAEMMRSRRRAA